MAECSPAGALGQSRRVAVTVLFVIPSICQVRPRFALAFAPELLLGRLFVLWQAVQPGSVRFKRGVVLLRSKVCVASGLMGCSLLDEVLDGWGADDGRMDVT